MMSAEVRSGRGWFIAGTDTGVGKTVVASALCRALAARGLRVAGMKPVASGSEVVGGALLNTDALALQSASSVELPYELVNPYCFAPPISPHLAARESRTRIDLVRIRACYERLASDADVTIVEGAGGWLTPISDTETMADLAASLALPAVLVVGLRLGCLNHTALTVHAIRTSGRPFAGWIANAIDPTFERPAENVATLERICGMPASGLLPFANSGSPDPVWAAAAVRKLLD